MKRVLTVGIIALSLLVSSYRPNQSKSYNIRTVVIDAGHGGHDTGCIGGRSKEKDVALGIALKLGNYIEKNFTDIKVVYTRKTDTFVELRERAAIANNNKADVFICIHCNSGPREAFGTETYVMGLHKTDDNLNVAKRENSSILFEDNYKAKYDGFDPNSPEANIIFSLYQNAFMEQSLILASKVQKDFREVAGRYSRGVRQAGFLVLYRTTMPSILIESGFLTNPAEEKFLSTNQGQDYIASSIFRAFKEYKNEMEGAVIQKVATDPNAPKKVSPVQTPPSTSPKTQNNNPASGNDNVGVTFTPSTINPEIPMTNIRKNSGNNNSQPAKSNTQAPLKRQPLSINPDAPKVYVAKNKSVTQPADTTAQQPQQVSTGSQGNYPFVLPSDTVVVKPKPKTQETKKNTKPVDPEALLRAADRAEYENSRKNKQTQDKIRQEAVARLKKELEEKNRRDEEQLIREAEEQARQLIEQDKKKKEDQKKMVQEKQQKVQSEHDARVKAEMERIRAEVEADYNKKLAVERTKLAIEIKKKIVQEQALSKETDESGQPLSPEKAEERRKLLEEIKDRQARARAIALELAKKNGNVEKYLYKKEKEEKTTKKQKVENPEDKPSPDDLPATEPESKTEIVKNKKEAQPVNNNTGGDYILDIPKIDTESTFLSVQVVNSPKPLRSTEGIFRGVTDLMVDKAPDNFYKYLHGMVYTFTEAISLQKQMRDKGFLDAFVVAYSNGKRITVNEARVILKDPTYKPAKASSDASQKKNLFTGSKKDRYSNEFIDSGSLKGIIYTVQVTTSPEPVSLNSSIFKGLTMDIIRDLEEPIIRYCVGMFGKFEEANEFRKQVKASGFPDAFVALYKNGKRQNQDQARLLDN